MSMGLMRGWAGWAVAVMGNSMCVSHPTFAARFMQEIKWRVSSYAVAILLYRYLETLTVLMYRES
jgi:hypothetical protein